MKKIMVMLTAVAVVGAASADFTAWRWTGGVISPTLAADTYIGGAVTLDNDLTLAPSYTGTTIDIVDIAGLLATHDLSVAPLVPFGGTYNAVTEESDASAVGQAWLVIDSNGGGIQVGDFIGLGNSGTIVDLQPDPEAPAGTPQAFAGGNITTNIEVIPEPATLGLMGIAGLGMYLARRKVRR